MEPEVPAPPEDPALASTYSAYLERTGRVDSPDLEEAYSAGYYDHAALKPHQPEIPPDLDR